MREQSLDQVISELREEGQHDSSGHFHIDFAARARKLAEHQSWEPALYLLQAVQAAVALKSPWLTIKLNRDLVEIGMAPPSGSLNLEALESGSAGESRYLGDLVKAAVAAGATGVSLTSDTEIWSWKDGTITYRPSPGPLRGGFPGADTKTLSIAVDHPKESLLARLFPSKRLAHVHQVLSTRCVLCPIPVRLDGRLLNLLYPEQAAWLRAGSIPATDWEGRRDYNWLGERHWLTSGPDSFCLASPACRTPYQVRVPSTVATHWGAQTSFTSVLSWFDGEIPEGAYAEISHSLQPSELPLQFKFDGPDLDTAQLVRTRVLARVGGCLQGALSDSPWGHNANCGDCLKSWDRPIPNSTTFSATPRARPRHRRRFSIFRDTLVSCWAA